MIASEYQPYYVVEAAREMVTSRKINKKAKKFEIKFEKALSRKAFVRAARIRRSYMNLAKKHPHLIG